MVGSLGVKGEWSIVNGPRALRFIIILQRQKNLPIADCRLPIADCRLPIADCRLPATTLFSSICLTNMPCNTHTLFSSI
jgi:hypothetical protein